MLAGFLLLRLGLLPVMLSIAAILLGSLLLFLIQPILAKLMLPSYGGSAGVWTSSMLFFQAALLGGYAFAHWIVTRFQERRGGAVYLACLGLSVFFAPITLRSVSIGEPATSVIATLALSVGLPFLMLSSTTPLVQAWHSRLQGELPSWLFALSNVASLTALLLYPFFIEPRFSLRFQLLAWSGGFLAWAILMAYLATRNRPEMTQVVHQPAGRERWLWLALAATASSLWLAVANHLSQDVAAIPFFWIVPLAIYLLSFVLTFDSRSWYKPALFRYLLPVGWIGIAVGFALRNVGKSLTTEFAVFSVALFVSCLFLHGELARRKPEAARLTSFYLTISAGGALGGVFVGLLAPLIFTEFLELPITLIACAVLAMGLLYGASNARVVRLGLTAVAAAMVAVYTDSRAKGDIFKDRNFYGTLWVRNTDGKREMFNGTTQHGAQWTAVDRELTPLTYYGPDSGIARALRAFDRRGLRMAVVGLGTGSMATYGKDGDEVVFYELNPSVTRTAAQFFTYLMKTPATVEVINGDARVSLEKEKRRFHCLVIDAFSGDAIPTHLLTREAVALYRQRLEPDGFLAFHVTNRYLDLAPVVRRLAEDAEMSWLILDNLPDAERGINFATWIILTKNEKLLETLRPHASVPLTKKAARLWTDDFSNLLEVLR
jgi:hypothetical protein